MSGCSNSSDDVPSCFICPLTLEIMNDPLMDRSGRNYERDAIVEWLHRGNSTCPLTREPLSYSKLVPNAALRLRIEKWKLAKGIEVTPICKNKNRDFACTIEPNLTIYKRMLAKARMNDEDRLRVWADSHQRSLNSSQPDQRHSRRLSVTTRRQSTLVLLENTISIIDQGLRRNQERRRR